MNYFLLGGTNLLPIVYIICILIFTLSKNTISSIIHIILFKQDLG